MLKIPAIKTARCIALVATCLVACAPSGISVISGISGFCVEGQHLRQYLKNHETTVLLHPPPWEYFGFYLKLPDDRPRTVSTKHHLPGIPEQLGDSWLARGYSPEDAVAGMEAEPVEVRGGRWFTWSTEPGDPVGTYIIEILVDGELLDTLRFEVVEGGDPAVEKGPIVECPELNPF